MRSDSADYIIIATGSDNKYLDIKGIQDAVISKKAVYSDGFLTLEVYPQEITIIGAGIVGIEFASYLNMIGKKVCILESQKSILNGMLDNDVNTIFIKELNKQGIEILTNIHIEEVDGGTIIYKKGDEYEECTSDLVVIAGGRIANIENIGLDDAEIKTDGKFVIVDEYCCTSNKKVYACGDVIGKSMLAHTAYREAEVVTDNICGINRKMEYYAIPSVIYSNPEIAVVGRTENELKNSKIKYYVKVGNGSSEIIFTLANMILNKQTETDIRNMIFPHPSNIEIIKEIACSKYS